MYLKLFMPDFQILTRHTCFVSNIMWLQMFGPKQISLTWVSYSFNLRDLYQKNIKMFDSNHTFR